MVTPGSQTTAEFDLVLIHYVHPSGWQLVATIGFHFIAPWAMRSLSPSPRAPLSQAPVDDPGIDGLASVQEWLEFECA